MVIRPFRPKDHSALWSSWGHSRYYHTSDVHYIGPVHCQSADRGSCGNAGRTAYADVDSGASLSGTLLIRLELLTREVLTLWLR